LLCTLIGLFLLPACDQNDDKPEEVDHFLVDLTGYVQKGPFIAGSSITISELNSDLQPTGKVYTTQIDNNSGEFNLPNVELESRFVQLKADGFYFNERTGELSEAQLTLYSLVDITDLESFNINVLSNLEKDRIVELMATGMAFADAKRKAMNDILGIFGFVSSEQLNSEQMDIASSGDDNAILLAVSIILQGDRPTSEFSELMSQIILDIREDGVLDNKSIGTDLINGINYADLQKIRLNTEERYDGFDIEYEIPDFEKHVTQFINTTTFIATNHFIFPQQGTYGYNAFQYEVTEVEAKSVNGKQYSMAVEVPKGRTLDVVVYGDGCGYSLGSLINMERIPAPAPYQGHHFSTTSSGLCDVGITFYYESGKSPKLNFEYYSDGNTEPYFTKEVEILTDHVPIDSTLLK